MISFIVIGKNEGWKLTQCINSIYESVRINKLVNFEIIYVDSNSEDDSLDRCIKFEKVIIYKLIDRCNPAIARNVGAFKSKGEILVFLDADMTVESNFINKMLINGELIHPLMAGRLIDRIIGKDKEVIANNIVHKRGKPYYKLITGGAFVIEKKIWDSAEGMDNRFVKGADPELGIRLATKGIFLLNLPYLFVVHHNDKYLYNKGREITLKSLNKNVLFSSMLTYRKNFYSKYAWKRLFTHEKTLISLFLSILLIAFFNNFLWIILYIVALFSRCVKSNTFRKFYKNIFYYAWRDVFVLIGFVMYFPKKIKTKDIKVESFRK